MSECQNVVNLNEPLKKILSNTGILYSARSTSYSSIDGLRSIIIHIVYLKAQSFVGAIKK